MGFEIKEQWDKDTHGTAQLSYLDFKETLFRIAHWWATHFDLEEYETLLEQIYERITWKLVIQEDGSQNHIIPKINICFPDEEIKIAGESEFLSKPLVENKNEWDDCPSDEDNKSEFEYKYEEDEATMSIKKFKRLKAKQENVVLVEIKDPIYYQEQIIQPQGFDKYTTIIDELMEPEYVLPFGYPTEQLFGLIKNEIHQKQSEIAEKGGKQTFTSSFNLEEEEGVDKNPNVDV